MTPEFVLGYTRQALEAAMLIGAPILTVGLVVGMTVAIFQAVTQIQEVTLTFIPKIVAMAIAAYLSASWMLEHALDFTRNSFTLMSRVGG
jgi:flagellar biosynthetic protein FliQ